MAMRLRLARGDITRWSADAIATSANAGLCGNRTPNFWRFKRFPNNTDAAVHAAAGPELAAALASHTTQKGLRIDRRVGHVSWRGALLPSATDDVMRCPTATAVVTPSFGLPMARYVVHAVAPDGLFRSGDVGDAEMLLRQTYTAAISAARAAGASSLALPAIGCGVHCWPPARAAHEAITAAVGWMGTESDSTLRRVDFVLRCDATLAAWRRACEERLLAVDDSDDGTHGYRLRPSSTDSEQRGEARLPASDYPDFAASQDGRSRNARRRDARRALDEILARA